MATQEKFKKGEAVFVYDAHEDQVLDGTVTFVNGFCVKVDAVDEEATFHYTFDKETHGDKKGNRVHHDREVVAKYVETKVPSGPSDLSIEEEKEHVGGEYSSAGHVTGRETALPKSRAEFRQLMQLHRKRLAAAFLIDKFVQGSEDTVTGVVKMLDALDVKEEDVEALFPDEESNPLVEID